MSFDYSKSITKESNSVVNKVLDFSLKSVAASSNKGGISLAKGVDKILSDIGAPNAVREAIRNVNAEVVNAGVKSATDIFQGILDGGFTSDTLKKFTSMDAISAALKRKDKTATDVNNLNVLAGAARKITTKPADITVDTNDSPYAADFANIFPPKFKFLFVVEFIFNSPFNTLNRFSRGDLHAVIHKFDRPKIDIDHDEVNMYNFTTQVPKLVKYGPVTMTAHDDVKGSALSMLMSYMKVMSPILNLDASNGMSHEAVGGMAFEDLNNASNMSSIQQGIYGNAGLTESGEPIDTTTSIFKEIRVYHVYNFGQFVDVYKYFNPKITSITMDEFDMAESNQGNSITFEIVYDGFYLDLKKSPLDVPLFSDINFSTQYNMVNRNVRMEASIAEQAAMEQHAKDSQKSIDDQIRQENYAITNGGNYKKDAALSQVKIDDQIRKENYFVNGGSTPVGGANSMPSSSNSTIAADIGKPGSGFDFG
jgi:hypothetical protein